MVKMKIMLMILLLLNGCSRTISAWNGKRPTEYLEIYGQDDLPSKLDAKKVQYRCVDLLYSSSGNTTKCYVTKDSSEKIDEWSARFYETSKGMLLDTGENAIVLGVLMLCNLGGNCNNVDFSHIKIKE